MSDWITFALPKGRILQDSMELFSKIGITCPEMDEKGSRKLVFENPEQKYRFMAVRATDVPTYVEYGCADIGVVGKDTLLEQGKNLFEPLDLKFGYCRLVVAEPKVLHDNDPLNWSNIRVATKYPNITERHFAAKGVQVELIKLYGSIELAPLVGLSERIVDLVSTGGTLKANGMVEVETIAEVTTRLIVNRASLKTKHQRIGEIIDGLEPLIGDEVKISQ